jgi:hypothetical protein
LNVRNGSKADIRQGEIQGFAALPFPFEQLSIALCVSDPKTSKAAAIEWPTPASELLDADRVAVARLLHGQQTTIDGGDNLCFAPGCPACVCWWQVLQ